MYILDVGAKFGIHSSFMPLQNIYNFILVDADLQEIKELKKKYGKKKNISSSSLKAHKEPSEAAINVQSVPKDRKFKTVERLFQ